MCVWAAKIENIVKVAQHYCFIGAVQLFGRCFSLRDAELCGRVLWSCSWVHSKIPLFSQIEWDFSIFLWVFEQS